MMPFDTNKEKTIIEITPELKEDIRNNLQNVPENVVFEVKRKPRTLDELRDNPFPTFPHEIYTEGPQVGTCKHCSLSLTGIQKLSLACTPAREKLRKGGW